MPAIPLLSSVNHPALSRRWDLAFKGVSPALHAASPAHALPNTKSTTQHPRTWTPGPRQWFNISSLSHPWSIKASARMGIALKPRTRTSR